MAAAVPLDANAQDAAAAAAQQWGGYMFKPDRTATPKLDLLLRGIAKCISQKYEKTDHSDLTPASLAAFYREVGGSYDQLFLHTQPQSVAFIYKNMSCPHSLQPLTVNPTMYSDPIVPALKPHGFVVWQSIQLLLGPAEHVPFIQEALRRFDVRDPNTGELFPKYIPSAVFPAYPDPKMESWHDTVSERLRLEARPPPAGRRPIDARPMSPASSSGDSTDDTMATTDAAHYFANPLYKNKEGRPGVVRQLTKAPARVLQGGKTVAQNVLVGGKLILSPGNTRKKSRSRSRSADRDGYYRYRGDQRKPSDPVSRPSTSDTRTPSSGRQRSHQRSRRPQSPTSSEEEAEDAFERDRRRKLRRYRSQEETPLARDVHDSGGPPRRHHSVHQTGTSSTSKKHDLEKRPNVSSRGPPDIENQKPTRNRSETGGSSSQQQGPQFNVTKPSPTSSSNQVPRSQQNSGPAVHQYQSEYSTRLWRQQQAQAQSQGQPDERRRSSLQRPSLAQPTASGRTSSADRRSYDGRRVSFVDPGWHENGYASSSTRPEDMPRSPLHSKGSGSRLAESQTYDSHPPLADRVRITPTTQKEWDGLRQTLSRKDSEGTNGSDRDVQGGPPPPMSLRDEVDDRAIIEREEPPAPGLFNGVKGRRYTVDVPWVKDG